MTQTSSNPQAISDFPEDFVDFYEFLGVPGNAPDSLVRERISELYSEAQANREHRHLARRREAEKALEVLPLALGALGVPEHRAAYDAYAIAARAGAAPVDFHTFLNRLDQNIAQRGGGLSLRETRVEPVAAGAERKPNQSARAATSAAPAPTVATPQAPAMGANWMAVAGAAIAAFVVCDALLHLSPIFTLIIAIVAAGAVWYRTGGAPAKKVGVAS